jgi:hypothetical protein
MIYTFSVVERAQYHHHLLSLSLSLSLSRAPYIVNTSMRAPQYGIKKIFFGKTYVTSRIDRITL